MEGTLNWILYPFVYSDLVTGLALRNTKLWCLEHLPQALTTTAAAVGFIPFYALKLALNMALFLVQVTLLVATLLLTAMYSGTKISIRSVLNISHKPQLDEELAPVESMSLAM